MKEEKKPNIEVITSGGIQCDNPKCDWKDETVTFEKLEEWLNFPCPVCTENLLTEEDYANSMLVHSTIDFINTLSEEELDNLVKLSGNKVENPDKMVNAKISTHKEIKVEIMKEEYDDGGKNKPESTEEV